MGRTPPAIAPSSTCRLPVGLRALFAHEPPASRGLSLGTQKGSLASSTSTYQNPIFPRSKSSAPSGGLAAAPRKPWPKWPDECLSCSIAADVCRRFRQRSPRIARGPKDNRQGTPCWAWQQWPCSRGLVLRFFLPGDCFILEKRIL